VSEQIKEALKLGASEYLAKSSFTPKDIIKKVHSIAKNP
jgi:DNA-binding NarL/FixJ family response regulator